MSGAPPRDRMSRHRILAIVLGLALVATTTVAAAVVVSNPGPFTGCLTAKAPKGLIYNVKVGPAPVAACRTGDTQITFSNGAGPQGIPGEDGDDGAPGANGVSRGWATIHPGAVGVPPNPTSDEVEFVVVQLPTAPEPEWVQVVVRATVTASGPGSSDISCQLGTSDSPGFNGIVGENVDVNLVAGEHRELTITDIIPGQAYAGLDCRRLDNDGPTVRFSEIHMTVIALDAATYP
jgi:hypothetical protein